MSELGKYVFEHSQRGDCICCNHIDGGEEVDLPENPDLDDTVNLTFFTMANKGGDREEFLALVKKEFPHWLDGKEHNYIEIGGEVGDQGLALQTIGLGHLLNIWKALSPDTMMSFLDKETKSRMAGLGMVALCYKEG